MALSFKKGTEAQKAASVMAEEIKTKPRSAKVENPFALSRWIVQHKLSSQKRRTLASRR